MTAILTHTTRDVLVGVIDLLRSRAVHAVAGQRQNYQPVSFCDGDPRRLARHYRDLGLRELYVADLDAIAGRQFNAKALALIAAAFDGNLILDLGWTGRPDSSLLEAMRVLDSSSERFFWVAATESMKGTQDLSCLADCVSAERLLLGLDYRMGRPLRSSEAGEGAIQDCEWIETASGLGCAGSVVLDLASVGARSGPTTGDLCRRLKQHWPDASIYSGGGLRSAEDVHDLRQHGCDRCLVATALYPQE